MDWLMNFMKKEKESQEFKNRSQIVASKKKKG